VVQEDGRLVALEALAGRATSRVPVTAFTWGFDYSWRVAGLEPWQLAFGGSDTWHRAHMAVLERHGTDVILYNGAGSGTEEATLLGEDARRWRVRDNNTGWVGYLTKDSLAVVDPETGHNLAYPVRDIHTREEVDAMIPEHQSFGPVYLEGLSRLMREAGDRALVLPEAVPGYICACYTLGFERSMEALIDGPEFLLYLADRVALGDENRMRELAAAGAEGVFIADSWASCDIVSPAQYERYAWPYQARTVNAAKAAGLRAILWNEGDLVPILKQHADLAIDGVAFEQPRKGFAVTVAKVREVFGPDRCVFGNLDSELMFMRNDPREIAEAVADQIRQSGPGASFILNTGSPLPSNVDPSAVDAMVSAARTVFQPQA